jgi:branched-chain amino acid transport system ATP-binding protein
MKQLAGSLSGGQRQLLAVGRGLMIEPLIMVMDEPSAGLSPKLVDDLFRDLKAIKDEGRIAIVMAEQNVACAQRIADDCLLLEEGRPVLSGPMATVIQDPKLQSAYLGI